MKAIYCRMKRETCTTRVRLRVEAKRRPTQDPGIPKIPWSDLWPIPRKDIAAARGIAPTSRLLNPNG